MPWEGRSARMRVLVVALCVVQSAALLRPLPAAARSRTCQPRLAHAVPTSPVPARVPFWQGSAPPPPRSSHEAAAPMLSGLQGQALRVEAADVPSRNEVRAVVPEHCYRRSTLRSLAYLVCHAGLEPWTSGLDSSTLHSYSHVRALPWTGAVAAVHRRLRGGGSAHTSASRLPPTVARLRGRHGHGRHGAVGPRARVRSRRVLRQSAAAGE